MLGGRREKLSENKIRAIRMLHENGFNDAEIARLMGICQTTVRKYKGDDVAIGHTVCSSMKQSAKLAKRGMNPKALNAAVEAGWYDNYIQYCLGIIEMVEKETGVRLRREW